MKALSQISQAHGLYVAAEYADDERVSKIRSSNTFQGTGLWSFWLAVLTIVRETTPYMSMSQHFVKATRRRRRFLTSRIKQGKYPRSVFSYVNSVPGKNQYDGQKPFHRAITLTVFFKGEPTYYDELQIVCWACMYLRIVCTDMYGYMNFYLKGCYSTL